MLILILAPSCFLLCSAAVTWTAKFDPESITIHMHEQDNVALSLYGLNYNEIIQNNVELHVRSDNDKLLLIDKKIAANEITEQGTWSGKIRLDAIFLGNPNVYVELTSADGAIKEESNEKLPVIIIREVRTIDHVFTGSVATLVSILYINFGAALNLQKLRGILRRPIGPAIGFAGQFVIMPLVSLIFCFGHILALLSRNQT